MNNSPRVSCVYPQSNRKKKKEKEKDKCAVTCTNRTNHNSITFHLDLSNFQYSMSYISLVYPNYNLKSKLSLGNLVQLQSSTTSMIQLNDDAQTVTFSWSLPEQLITPVQTGGVYILYIL